MFFEENNIYHIYNQGNNRQKIFFNRENYLFFLRKMKTFLLPYGDLMAWCLMPNHFHWMMYVRVTDIHTFGLTSSQPITSCDLNNSIGILLRSYTRAINKQESRSGALFREETKAECLTKANQITPSFYKSASCAIINTHNHECEYPKACFDYIHQNPVASKLSINACEWEFSSYRDVIGQRDGKLINRMLIDEWKLR